MGKKANIVDIDQKRYRGKALILLIRAEHIMGRTLMMFIWTEIIVI